MSLDVLLQGKLRGAVTIRTASNGNAYAMFKLAATDKKNESLLCSCIAFQESAVDAIQRLDNGDAVAVSGEAAISAWTGQDGTPRHGLDVTVYQVMTVYHLGRKRADKPKGGPVDRGSASQGGDDFGDAGSFND